MEYYKNYILMCIKKYDKVEKNKFPFEEGQICDCYNIQGVGLGCVNVRHIEASMSVGTKVSHEDIPTYFIEVKKVFDYEYIKTIEVKQNKLRKMLSINKDPIEPIIEVHNSYIDLGNYDEELLFRIHRELLIYLFKIRDKELLLQFSSLIKEELLSLSIVYDNRDLVDFEVEFSKVKFEFKKIYEICNPMQNESDRITREYRMARLVDLMDRRKKIVDINMNMLTEVEELFNKNN